MALVLQAASREALTTVGARLDAYVDGASAADLARVGDELFAFTRLLVAQKALRRLLGDPATPEAARTRLVEQVLGGQLSEPALGFVRALVQARWSQSLDLIDGAEAMARRAVLGPAEKAAPSRRARPGAGSRLDDVEDELFRFGRILDREPELNGLLADDATPEAGRVALLDQVLAGKVSAVTAALLRQTVRLPRGRHLDLMAEELAELAATRRDRSVARVSTAVALTGVQEQKLTDSLTRLYGRPISLQIELDVSLLGGLVVQVGGEVIDGSVAGRIAVARRAIPS